MLVLLLLLLLLLRRWALLLVVLSVSWATMHLVATVCTRRRLWHVAVPSRRHLPISTWTRARWVPRHLAVPRRHLAVSRRHLAIAGRHLAIAGRHLATLALLATTARVPIADMTSACRGAGR